MADKDKQYKYRQEIQQVCTTKTNSVASAA